MTRPTHLPELLRTGGGDAVALSAPDRPDLTYDGLRNHVAATVSALNERGIGRGDRVAIVLPNGPEMASAFVSMAAGATTAPLNPAYRQTEFEFYLSDLRAKAVVLAEGDDSPARAAAAQRQGWIGAGCRTLSGVTTMQSALPGNETWNDMPEKPKYERSR